MLRVTLDWCVTQHTANCAAGLNIMVSIRWSRMRFLHPTSTDGKKRMDMRFSTTPSAGLIVHVTLSTIFITVPHASVSVIDFLQRQADLQRICVSKQ